MQKMSQSIAFQTVISQGLSEAKDIQLVSDQTDNIVSITAHCQKLGPHIYDRVYIKSGCELKILFEIKHSPTQEAWGMGRIQLFLNGKLGGQGLQEEFSFKVFSTGFFKDQPFAPSIELSVHDLLIKTIQLIEKCDFGRAKTIEEFEADHSSLARREVFSKETVLALK